MIHDALCSAAYGQRILVSLSMHIFNILFFNLLQLIRPALAVLVKTIMLQFRLYLDCKMCLILPMFDVYHFQSSWWNNLIVSLFDPVLI